MDTNELPWQLPKMISTNINAWSDSQIASKLWLCQNLELLCESVPYSKHNHRIAVYAGWYGILPFMLLTRDNIEYVQWIRSIDIDPVCEPIADEINCHWVMEEWKFKATTKDVNEQRWTMPYSDPTIVINTSTEHFDKQDWFFKIPKGVIVAVQSTNMEDQDHINTVNSLEELKNRYPMSKVDYSGVKQFSYPNKNFQRFMIIGQK